MDINQYFSFSRIGLVMKRDLMENWKTNLYRFLGPYAGFLLVMIFGYLNSESNYAMNYPERAFNNFANSVMSALLAILIIAGAYYASYVMETMRTQQSRVSYLMLPATMLEKFVARSLFVTVGFLLMIVVALFLAEATRFLFLPLFDVPDTFNQSIFPYIWEKVTWVNTSWYGCTEEVAYMNGLLMKIAAIMAILWLHSFFILGGCYWYKKPFWKTLGVGLLVFIVLCWLMVKFVEFMQRLYDSGKCERFYDWFRKVCEWMDTAGGFTFIIVLLTIFIVFNWWRSYKVFTRSQVIKPKFRLL